MPRASQVFGSQFFKATEFGSKPLTLTIHSCSIEVIQGEEKYVVEFVEDQRRLVLNATNGRAIAAIHGDEMDDWPGCTVTLIPATAKNPNDPNGDPVPAIRVQAPTNGQPAAKAAVAVPAKNADMDDEIPF